MLPNTAPITGQLNARLDRRFGQYQLSGRYQLAAPSSAQLTFTAWLPSNLDSTKPIQLLLQAQAVDLAQWLKTYNWHGYSLQQGLGNIKLNAHWQGQHWQRIKAEFTLQQLAFSGPALACDAGTPLAHAYPALTAFYLPSDLTASENPLAAPWAISIKNSCVPFRLMKSFIAQTTGKLVVQPQQPVTIQLHLNDAALDLLPIFRAPLSINQAQLTANVTSQAQNWLITLPMLTAQNQQIAVSGQGTLLIPKQGNNPYLDLSASATAQQLTKVSAYLPVNVLNPKVTHWLDTALLSTTKADGQVHLKGYFADFPFDDHQGIFQIAANVWGADLKYWPDWPVIQQLNGHLLFAGRSMAITINSAKIYHSLIKSAQANIAYMGDTQPVILQINGLIQSNIADSLQFLRQSPLQNQLATLLPHWQGTGATNVALGLTIPLANTNAPLAVSGKIQLQDADLRNDDWPIDLPHLQGVLEFTENGLTAGKIQTQLWQQPLSIALSSNTTTTAHTINMNLQGILSSSALQNQFPTVVWLKNWMGNTPFTAQLQFAGTAISQLQLQSNLQGINCQLPYPFAKSATQIMPSQIKLQLANPALAKLQLNYGQQMAGLLELRNNNKQWQITRGLINLGSNALANLPNTAGITVTGHLDNLNWDDWAPYFTANNSSTTSTNNPSTLINNISLRFDKLQAFGLSFNRIAIQTWQNSSNRIINLQSPDLAGNLTIPNRNQPNQTWIIQLQRCYLTALANQTRLRSLQPGDLPAVNGSCDDFRWNDLNFGKVTLQFHPLNNNRLQIDQVTADSRYLHLAAQGLWLGSPQRTQLTGDFTSTDLGGALQAWGLSRGIESQNTNIRFALNWPDAPYSPSLTHLNGNVNIQVKKGRIPEVGQQTQLEMDAGRLLNILSPDTILRRLQLDFSDLTKQGFSFDYLTGAMQIVDSNAYSNNIQLDGPVAHVAMKGKIGLESKDYDLQLQVNPHFTSSLPVVAAIAGGPIAGVATWVANKLLTPEMQRITGYHYRVIGPWNNPQVISLVPNQGKS